MIGKFLSQEVPVYQAGLAFLCLYLSIEYFKGSLDKKSGREVKNSNNNDNNSDLNNNNVTVQKKGEKGNSSNAEEENKTATKSVTQSEVDQEAEEYMDEEDSLLAVKNSYGMLDGPFKLMLCVNMSLNMGKVSLCLLYLIDL